MVNFTTLWENHPTISGDAFSCSTNGRPNFPDQCSIRLGTSLALSGVDTRVLHVRHCWFHPNSKGHILRAQELASALAKAHFTGVGKMQKVDPTNFQCDLRHQSGIIFFKDFWLRAGETIAGRSGDHIDLWNGSRLTDWQTWLTISCWLGVRLTYPRSREIWFWPVR